MISKSRQFGLQSIRRSVNSSGEPAQLRLSSALHSTMAVSNFNVFSNCQSIIYVFSILSTQSNYQECFSSSHVSNSWTFDIWCLSRSSGHFTGTYWYISNTNLRQWNENRKLSHFFDKVFHFFFHFCSYQLSVLFRLAFSSSHLSQLASWPMSYRFYWIYLLKCLFMCCRNNCSQNRQMRNVTL